MKAERSPALMQTSLLSGLPEPAGALGHISLDDRLNEVLPGDHHAWPQRERERLVERVVGLLVDDMAGMFESHQQRNHAGCLVFRDEEDRQDFLALLGWVCGYGSAMVSHVPFTWAMRYLGFDARAIRAIREAVAEAYANELGVVRTLFSRELSVH